ncbi:hypothetical protein [Rickettsia endosymbiont of Ixodes pacificus]|nr:hypothetical protein [Rickettsia endosymbiont of Ixodes pacificus]
MDRKTHSLSSRGLTTGSKKQLKIYIEITSIALDISSVFTATCRFYARTT